MQLWELPHPPHRISGGQERQEEGMKRTVSVQREVSCRQGFKGKLGNFSLGHYRCETTEGFYFPTPNHPRVWCLLQGSEVGGKGGQEKEPSVSSGVPRGLTEAIIPSGQGIRPPIPDPRSLEYCAWESCCQILVPLSTQGWPRCFSWGSRVQSPHCLSRSQACKAL